MLAVISPAKRLDFTSDATTAKHSLPAFLKESKQLIDVLRARSPKDIAKLMGLSAKLADLNYQRYGDWQTPFTTDNARQAALAFSGDVYQGLDARTLTDRDWTWAQKHLRILSGLYGLLKPLDLIQPYRLEMGTRLGNPRGEDLYAFWGAKLTKALNDAVAEQRQPIVVNLASNEYWEAVDTAALNARVITPVFKDLKNGRYKFLSFYAKKARGLMARYLIDHRVSTLKALQDFDVAGYYFCEAQSRGDNWVFLRDKPR
ncbi:MAG: peroxide stress protein YaaA [Pseudomonadales bacterium]